MSCGVYFLCRQHGEMPYWHLFDSLSLIFSSKKMCTHSAKLLLVYKRWFSPCVLSLLHLPSYFPVFPLAEAHPATTAVPPKKNPDSTALWNFIYERKAEKNSGHILNASALLSRMNCQGESGGLISVVSPSVWMDEFQGCIFMRRTHFRVISSDWALVPFMSFLLTAL